MKKVIAICVSTVILFGCGGPTVQQKGSIFAESQKNSGNLSIRVIAFEEKSEFAQILAGAFYEFEFRVRPQQNWKKIFAMHHDDAIPINEEWIGILNDRVAYVFMRYQYAVTTDGGFTWSLWALDRIAEFDRPNCIILKIRLLENGTGEMDVRCSENISVLQTDDFGKNWTPNPALL